MTSEEAEADDTGIAIVGMSGRFPGARDIEELWALLSEGRHAFTQLSDQALQEAGVSDALRADPRYVKVSATLRDIDLFDAEFFGYSAQQALELDPQHRLFLECAWHALEDAGCNPDSFPGAIGVFAGAGFSRYGLMHAMHAPDSGSFLREYARVLASDKDFLTTRVSYKLGLRGPSIAVQTGCSTSLVAVHLACQSLLSGECDLALAGGVSIQIPQGSGYLWNEGGITAPDGRCRAFDADARGTVPGSGVGIVALARLSDALARREHIYAVIRGSAVNNDGRDKVSYTAPSVSGQAEVIAQALAQSGVDPRTIGFIEAHGTGTVLGDAVELAALTRAYGGHSLPPASCALGALKTNIGHLDTAAGVTGLIKAALCLQKRTRVATLNFQTPNDAFGADSPFHVETTSTAWPDGANLRRAAVSSFGIGGTNAHAVLEEAPDVGSCGTEENPCVFPLSARTPTVLARLKADLLRHLQQHEELPLPSIARTLHVGRRAFAVRDAFVACNRAELLGALDRPASSQVLDPNSTPRPVFLFSHDDASSTTIVRSLMRSHSALAAHLARTLACVPETHRASVAACFPSTSGERTETPAGPIARTARFSATFALASTLAEWGVAPSCVVGWGDGHYVAACLAGALSLNDALAELCGVLPQPPARSDVSAVPGHASIQWLSARTGQPLSAERLAQELIDEAANGSAVLSSDCIDSLMRIGLVHVTFGAEEVSAPPAQALPGVTLDEAASVPAVLLRQLAHLWRLGLAIDWTRAHGNSDLPKVVLPGYPFDRQRYWLQEAQSRVATPAPARPDIAQLPNDEWFSVPIWEPAPAYGATSTASAGIRGGAWLVFASAAEPDATVLTTRLRAYGATCASLTGGERFEERANLDYVVNPREEAHMVGAIEALRSEGVKPRYVVLFATTNADAFGVVTLLRSFSSLYPDDRVDVVVLTSGAAGINTDPSTDADSAIVHGLTAVLATELPNENCIVVDFPVRDSDDACNHRDTYFEWLALEVTAARSAPFVAYRQGRRLTRGFARLHLDATDEVRRLREGGVYLITGGLGRIGLALARSLAGKCRARLLLTCRRGVPGYAGSRPGAPLDLEALARIKPEVAALSGVCSELMIVHADAGDEAQMRQAIAPAEARWGRINGVLHLAADLSSRSAESSVRELAAQDFQSQARPKVCGFQVVEKILGEHNLDFAVAFSSNATIFGGAGLGAYAAANAFLNVAALGRDTHLPWLTMSWDGWVRRNGADPGGTSISDALGVEAFWRVFASARSPWVVVSTLDVPKRLAALRSLARPAPTAAGPMTALRVPRDLRAPAVPPRTDLEKQIVAIWEEALGVEGIGIEDDLFELNGDSMMAMDILARIREVFLVEVPLRGFLSSQSTIRRLSREIAAQLAS